MDKKIILLVVAAIVISFILGITVSYSQIYNIEESSADVEMKKYRKENEDLSVENQNLRDQIAGLQGQMGNLHTDEEMNKAIQDQVNARDDLWVDGIESAFLRTKPTDIIRAEITAWNNSRISDLADYKIEATQD